MEEVRAIAGRAGVDEAAVRRGAPYTEIVQAVGDAAGPAASAIYLSWKLCSGMAHGDFWPTWSAMQRVELPGAPKGTGTFKIEADVKLLMYVTALAVNLTRQGCAAVRPALPTAVLITTSPVPLQHPQRGHDKDRFPAMASRLGAVRTG